jgi:hypothetical protein
MTILWIIIIIAAIIGIVWILSRRRSRGAA